MDATLLARIQFGFTAGFHFLFPPLTIGTSWLIVYFMGKYRNTGDELYGKAARFWLKLFALTFTVGVASGIVLEFQFGMNWSEYSRFVGDIFGAPLAAEGILAFFLESTFVGVLVFGWGRFSRRTLHFASVMVAVGATLSAFWIIVANSWQQTPAGYHLREGRAELANFFQAVFNPSTLPRYFHTIGACLITGAFFMLGVSAWLLLKARRRSDSASGAEAAPARSPAMISFKAALVTAFAASVLELFLGHWHGVQVAHTQGAKLGAIEGLFKTQRRAPAVLFGIPDEEAETVHAAVRIPGALSLLAFGKLDAEVKGLDAYPREHWPPVRATFFCFHAMVALGLLFVVFSGSGLFLLWRKKLFRGAWTRPFLIASTVVAPLPLVANELGWLTAELGRQPWIVYGLLKTSQAVSVSVPAWQVLLSLIVFVVLYGALGALWIFLVCRAVKRAAEQRAL